MFQAENQRIENSGQHQQTSSAINLEQKEYHRCLKLFFLLTQSPAYLRICRLMAPEIQVQRAQLQDCVWTSVTSFWIQTISLNQNIRKMQTETSLASHWFSQVCFVKDSLNKNDKYKFPPHTAASHEIGAGCCSLLMLVSLVQPHLQSNNG